MLTAGIFSKVNLRSVSVQPPKNTQPLYEVCQNGENNKETIDCDIERNHDFTMNSELIF